MSDDDDDDVIDDDDDYNDDDGDDDMMMRMRMMTTTTTTTTTMTMTMTMTMMMATILILLLKMMKRTLVSRPINEIMTNLNLEVSYTTLFLDKAEFIDVLSTVAFGIINADRRFGHLPQGA